VGPRDHALGEGPDPPQGKGQLWRGLFPPLKCIVIARTAKTAELYTIYSVPTDIVWLQQYTGVVRSCVYANKQFKPANCAIRCA